MSASTNTGNILRAKSKICYCGFKAIMKITDNKKDKGKLYYACPRGECSLWKWCKRGNPSGWIEDPAVRMPSIEVDEGTSYLARIELLESRIESLKLLIAVALVVSILNFTLYLVK